MPKAIERVERRCWSRGASCWVASSWLQWWPRQGESWDLPPLTVLPIAMVKSMIRDLEEDGDRQMRMSDGWLRQKLPIVLDEMV